MLIIDNPVRHDQLRNTNTRVNYDGSSRYQSLNHSDVADELISSIVKRSIPIKSQKFTVCKDGAGMLGVVEVMLNNGAEDFASYQIGIRHSNDGRWSLGMIMGLQISVCTNGMFFAEKVLNRKHTSGINLGDSINQGMEWYLANYKRMCAQINGLKRTRVGDQWANTLLVDAGMENVVPWSVLKDVTMEWRKPTFEDFEERTAWSLYNAFTYRIKKMSPVSQMNRLQGVQKFFTSQFPVQEVIDV